MTAGDMYYNAAMPPRHIPEYLTSRYWWAYVHPNAVWFFERQWLVNLILFGNYMKLRDTLLQEIERSPQRKTLQVSCCYGDMTPRLARCVAASEEALDVVDILPIQLENLRRKLPSEVSVRLLEMDAASLTLEDARYDKVVLFFLLHEEPQEYRERTIREALRVVKPDGTIIIVDYGVPSVWHPLRYLVLPWLGLLEPSARALWRRELTGLLPEMLRGRSWKKTSYFGGLYQKLVGTARHSARALAQGSNL